MIVVLTEKIISLALIMLLGVALVKFKVLKPEESNCLSRLSLYVIIPCVIINSFQVSLTPDVRDGLLLALAGAMLMNAMFLMLNEVLKRVLHLDAVEQTSIIYTNAGNLVIPIIVAILGEEWVIYSMAFISVQMVMLWSHGKLVLCREEKWNLKKILTNINMIAVIAGVILFFSGIRFPSVVQDAMSSVGSMVGPVSMLVTGLLLGSLNLKEILLNKRAWVITVLRLVVVPLCGIALFKFSGICRVLPNGSDILLVTILATITPPASSVMQMADLYGLNADHACAINVLTTFLCILTMPLMVAIYQM